MGIIEMCFEYWKIATITTVCCHNINNDVLLFIKLLLVIYCGHSECRFPSSSKYFLRLKHLYYLQV